MITLSFQFCSWLINIFNLFFIYLKWNNKTKTKWFDVFSKPIFEFFGSCFCLIGVFFDKNWIRKKERKSFSQKVSSHNKSSEKSDCSPKDDQHKQQWMLCCHQTMVEMRKGIMEKMIKWNQLSSQGNRRRRWEVDSEEFGETVQSLLFTIISTSK